MTDDTLPHPTLSNTPTDYSVSVTKGILGAIPFAGSLLAELVANVIPNQRVDRLAKFVEVLNAKLSQLDQAALRTRLTDPHGVDLVEEGFYQAIRAVSEERKRQIADVVKHGLASDAQATTTAKRVLLLLAQLDEVDVIFLMAYHRGWARDREFTQKHWDVLKPVSREVGAPLEQRERAALHEYRKDRLVQLGLLEADYAIDTKTRMPVFDPSKRDFKRESYRVTSLGRLVLRHLDADAQGPDATPTRANGAA